MSGNIDKRATLSNEKLSKVSGGSELPNWLITVAKVTGDYIITIYVNQGIQGVRSELEKKFGKNHWVTKLVPKA